TAVGSVEDVADLQRTRTTPGASQRAPSAERLDAAALTAPAHSSVRIDRDVADLACRAARAAPQCPADDDARSHASAQVEIGDRRAVGGSAQRCSAQRSGFDVVLHRDWGPKTLRGT